jgi:hypothetical protein
VIIVVQKIVGAHVVNVKIHIPIAVIVCRGYAFGEGRPIDTGRVGDILKSPVSFVQEKLGRTRFVDHKQVQQAVVVNVRPNGRLCISGGYRQATLFGHIREGSVAVVTQ